MTTNPDMWLQAWQPTPTCDYKHDNESRHVITIGILDYIENT